MSTFLDGPFCSLVLCLLAGIALRYAIYHGQDRSSEEDASRLGELERVHQEFRERQFALQGALEAALRSETQLRANVAGLLADMEGLRSQPALEGDADQSNPLGAIEAPQRMIELEQELSRQEVMLRELRLQKEEVLTQLERERNLRQELAQSLASPGPHRAVAELPPVRQYSPRGFGDGGSGRSDPMDGQELPQILAFTPHSVAAMTAGHCIMDPVKGPIYDRPPEHRDDLRRISGVGEILSARLNGLGIYTFKQIMQWEPHHVREFSRLLSFRDRIERDQWVAQARRLYQETQGEAA